MSLPPEGRNTASTFRLPCQRWQRSNRCVHRCRSLMSILQEQGANTLSRKTHHHIRDVGYCNSKAQKYCHEKKHHHSAMRVRRRRHRQAQRTERRSKTCITAVTHRSRSRTLLRSCPSLRRSCSTRFSCISSFDCFSALDFHSRSATSSSRALSACLDACSRY